MGVSVSNFDVNVYSLFIISVCLELLDLPLDREWEIEKDNLILGETLGEGAFGVVVKAEALSIPSRPDCVSTVAVKMLKGAPLLSPLFTMASISVVLRTLLFCGEVSERHPTLVPISGFALSVY